MERRNAWLSYKEAEEAEMEKLAKAYREFLDKGKTERECVTEIVKEAEAAGYESLESKIEKGEKIKAGDKVYAVGMKKIVALFHVGCEELSRGMSILCAHIDSPRLDVKQNPLYEDTDLAYLDTHYYGGVKKYQWVTLPLAMHGVVAKKDGSVVEVSIGEDEEDPVLYITDLLIHLSGKQLQKKAAEVIEGENLDILIGSRPLADLPDDKKKDAVKQNVLNILNEKYGIEEEDFLSAELEIVPAGKARDCGLDRSMIAAYGQDDRVCAYTSLAAMLEMKETPKRTGCCLLVDKAYAEAFEKKNAAYLGRGIVLNKFTGARGKSGSNDANAEYVARVRRIFDDHDVAFQTAELGKVDFGGGGTIAYIAALYGMEVIDSGVAVLSMHAPWEVTSKADVYEAYKAYKAFLLDA